MAGLGKWEEAWKESVRASVVHGTEKFLAEMLKGTDRDTGKGASEAGVVNAKPENL
jgi:hypothetical protein